MNFLGQGGSAVQLRAQVLGSGEYLFRTGGSDASFLMQLYQDTFGRTIDATGGVVWAAALAKGVKRSAIAAQVLSSGEARFNLIVSAYQGLLRRAPDESGLRHFTAALQKGQSSEQLVAEIAGSDEYYARV